MRIPSRFLLSLALAFFAFGVQAQSLTTLFASNNGQSCTYFDVCNNSFLNPIFITGFDVNLDAGSWNMEVGLSNTGTHVGNIITANYSVVGTATVTGAGLNLPTSVPIGGITIGPSACVGLYMCVTNGTGQNYTNGPAAGVTVWNGGNCNNGATVSNADISIFASQGSAYPNTGGGFCPRIFNGTVYYTTNVNCVPPGSLMATSTGAHSVDVSWTSVSSNLTNSTVVYVPCGMDPLTSPLAQSVVGVSSPITIGNLIRDQCYDFYVFDNCTGSPAASDTTGPASATPICPPSMGGGAILINDFSNLGDNLTLPSPYAGSDGQNWTIVDPNGATAPTWRTEVANTGSLNTGPLGGHGGSGTHVPGNTYTYLETSGGTTGLVANFISPPINLTGTIAPILSFWYHMFGATIGTLNVGISTTGAAGTYTNVFTRSGQQHFATGDPWLPANINLNAYIGQTIHIRFQGIRSTSFTGDISIDDIVVVDPPSITPDLQVSALVNPANGDCNCEGVVQLLLENTSLGSINGGTASVNVSGALTGLLNVSFPDTIPPSGTTIIDVGTINTCQGGTFNFDIVVATPGDNNLCNDSLTAIVVLPSPTIPNPQLAPGCVTVQNGQTTVLQVQNPVAGQVYRWYDACGGNLVHEGVNFLTDPIFGATNFGLVCVPLITTPTQTIVSTDFTLGTSQSTTTVPWGMQFTVSPSVSTATLNQVQIFNGNFTGVHCAQLTLIADPSGTGTPGSQGIFCANVTAGAGGTVPMNFGGLSLIPGATYNLTRDLSSTANPTWFHPWAIGNAPHVMGGGNITFNGYVSGTTQAAPGTNQLGLVLFYTNFDIAFEQEDCPSDCVEACIVVPAQAVPTVGEWGLIILCMLLLSFSIVFMGRTQHAFSLANGQTLRYMPENLTGPFPFVKDIFHKAMAIALALVVIGFVLSLALTGMITTVDIIGSFIATPIAAYLFHLIWIFNKSDQE